ncbi:hypothetical protein ACFSL6_27780 [Paenibacillus thailandensis]|uniref:Integral membrane protein n=1 Tax=Paenibacillus thailandensis TaxID=393250 RepID=A0ABW5R3T0_9BACL
MEGRKSYYRATCRVLLLAAAGAAASGLTAAGAAVSPLIADRIGTIAFLLAIGCAVLAAGWFRGRYWYYPVFVPVLWVPLSVLALRLLAFVSGGFSEAGHDAIYIYIWLWNAAAVAAGAVLGILARGLIGLVRALERNR